MKSTISMLKSLSCVFLLASLNIPTACKNNDVCDGIGGDLSVRNLEVFYIDRLTGENLLEESGSPISNENIQIQFERNGEPIIGEVIPLQASAYNPEMGTSLHLIYEVEHGETLFIISLQQYPSDTISIQNEGSTVMVSMSDSSIYNYTICDTWQAPLIVISK